MRSPVSQANVRPNVQPLSYSKMLNFDSAHLIGFDAAIDDEDHTAACYHVVPQRNPSQFHGGVVSSVAITGDSSRSTARWTNRIDERLFRTARSRYAVKKSN